MNSFHRTLLASKRVVTKKKNSSEPKKSRAFWPCKMDYDMHMLAANSMNAALLLVSFPQHFNDLLSLIINFWLTRLYQTRLIKNLLCKQKRMKWQDQNDYMVSGICNAILFFSYQFIYAENYNLCTQFENKLERFR